MKLKFRNLLLATSLALLAPLAAHASLQTLSGLYVFGDSLSDGGNYNGPGGAGAFPPAPYAGARYSNGPTAVENLWQAYNPGDTSFKPSNAVGGGTNYALGGATTGKTNFNSVNPGVPTTEMKTWFASQGGVTSQVAQFADGCNNCITDPATSLFVVWAFANDVFYNGALATAGFPYATPTELITAGITNITNAIQALAGEGAQHFLIPNLPDLGITPNFLGTGLAGDMTNLSMAYNYALAGALNALGSAMSSIEIVQFDVFGLFGDVVANPAQYGFSNVTEQCVQNLSNGRCDPNTWLFWDSVHPTAAGHALLGERFAAAVPEPATWWLMLPALVLLARRRLTGVRAA